MVAVHVGDDAVSAILVGDGDGGASGSLCDGGHGGRMRGLSG